MSVALALINYCLIGLNIIIACIILNWASCFGCLSRSQCLMPRRPLISVSIGTLLICNIAFGVIDRSAVVFHANWNDPTPYPGWLLINALCIEFWILTLFSLAYRAWIMCYRIEFSLALKDEKWRLYINPAENNWYLKHRKTYGRSKRMIFPCVISWFLTACIYWLLVINYNGFTISSALVIVLQILMAMLFLLYICRTISVYHDVWRISPELFMTAKLCICAIVTFFILCILPISAHVRYTLLSTLGTFTALSIACAILYYPLHKFKLPTFLYGATHVSKTIASTATEILIATKHFKKQQLHVDKGSQTNRNKFGNQFYKLKAILAHKDGFRLFSLHLMKEYSIEHLLFFVETSQWLEYMRTCCDEQNIVLSADEKTAMIIDIKFHENVPRSRIVYWNRADDRPVCLFPDIATPASTTETKSNNLQTHHNNKLTLPSGTLTHLQQLTIDLNMDDFEIPIPIIDPWMQCVKLFQKYVINGSYFCVNISGERRIVLYRIMGYDTFSTKSDSELVEILMANCNNDMNKLFHVFDSARYAVFRLMIQTVARFETSDIYSQHFMMD